MLIIWEYSLNVFIYSHMKSYNLLRNERAFVLCFIALIVMDVAGWKKRERNLNEGNNDFNRVCE